MCHMYPHVIWIKLNRLHSCKHGCLRCTISPGSSNQLLTGQNFPLCPVFHTTWLKVCLQILLHGIRANLICANGRMPQFQPEEKNSVPICEAYLQRTRTEALQKPSSTLTPSQRNKVKKTGKRHVHKSTERPGRQDQLAL